MATSTDLAFAILLVGLLFALSWIDVRRGILPNSLTFPLGVGGLAQSLVVGDPPLMNALLGAAFAAALLGLTALGYRALRGSDGLGMGDIKFVGAAGLWVGWEGIPVMLLIASLGGLSFAASRALTADGVSLKTRLPFGPFLCAGTFFAWLLHMLR